MSKKKKKTSKSKDIRFTPEKDNKNIFISLPNLITIFATLISVIIALGSLMYSKNTYDLAFEQVYEEKKAVWLSEVNQENNEITFTTNNENIAMQFALIKFPEPFSDSNREILFPNFSLPTNAFIIDLEKLLESKYSRKEGYATVVESSVPFVLQAYYVVKGSSYSIQSLYHLRYLVTMGDQEEDFPTVEIAGFWFDRHLEIDEDPNEALMKIWGNSEYREGYSGLVN
ncbi:hypothetical protein CSV67_02800 [Sporosarcina sp. P2]|uniref:hypothetical protein n=1 Tax=Sporosarcina sp. P2 TaxID=2048251 RepID=UPI000C16D4E6|nr:hypothetical protein [Sporosarcina sp. P2]PID03588.1 hypothetical protein CSV67_02800 [Sporosarcina sp. P2]